MYFGFGELIPYLWSLICWIVEVVHMVTLYRTDRDIVTVYLAPQEHNCHTTKLALNLFALLYALNLRQDEMSVDSSNLQ